jgi:hypothetical protein
LALFDVVVVTSSGRKGIGIEKFEVKLSNNGGPVSATFDDAAPYALQSTATRGRKYPEPEHRYRGPFQRDRDRIVHSSAYRRLSSKTQVLPARRAITTARGSPTRLEVASIARTLVGLPNEDLIEARPCFMTSSPAVWTCG